MKLLELGILSLCFTLSASAAKPKLPKDAILLSNVKSLTLRAGAKTSHRRVSAIPQLTCQGPGCKHHTVEIMRCQNMGSDYEEEDVQWSCTANLPDDFKLGATEVACEGYKGPDDPAVLKGSCGVTYRLLLTEKGEEKYGTTWWGGSKGTGNKAFDKSNIVDGEGTDWGGWLFMILFVGVLFWIIYKFLTAVGDVAPAERRPRQYGGNWGNGWGGGGGGGGGGLDDPPPPYYGKDPYGNQSTQGWRPGFWSGTAAGAAAAYAAGAARGNRAETREVPRTGGGWFGGGGGTTRAGSSNWGDTPSRSNSGSSSARYESTGFGSTTRR